MNAWDPSGHVKFYYGKQKETTVTRKQQHEKWYPIYETHILSNYDDNSNISKIEIKSRKEDEAGCQTQTVKTDYDGKGFHLDWVYANYMDLNGKQEKKIADLWHNVI